MCRTAGGWRTTSSSDPAPVVCVSCMCEETIVPSTSTPSTRRLLDSVAVPLPHRSIEPGFTAPSPSTRRTGCFPHRAAHGEGPLGAQGAHGHLGVRHAELGPAVVRLDDDDVADGDVRGHGLAPLDLDDRALDGHLCVPIAPRRAARLAASCLGATGVGALSSDCSSWHLGGAAAGRGGCPGQRRASLVCKWCLARPVARRVVAAPSI